MSLRLRRALNRRYGYKAPSVEDAAVTVRMDEEGWSHTFEVTLTSKTATEQVAASTSAIEDLYSAALNAAFEATETRLSN